MATTPSRLSIDDHVGGNVLVLHGDVDSHTAALLESRFDALGTSEDRTLDLTDVVFIDSSGLRVIIAAHQAHADGGTRLVLRSASPAVSRLLEITGLDEHLHLEP